MLSEQDFLFFQTNNKFIMKTSGIIAYFFIHIDNQHKEEFSWLNSAKSG